MIASGSRSLRQEIALGLPSAPVRLENAVQAETGAELAPTPGTEAPVHRKPDLHEAERRAVGPDGTVWVADAAGHRVLRIDPCGGPPRTLHCLTGPSAAPGRVSGPRGLAVGPRAALYIADTGNHRIQVVDLDTGSLRAVWGPADPYARPQPGTEPGRFDSPSDVAADAACALYVADTGNGRVQKLDLEGRPDPAFAAAWASASERPARPLALDTVRDGEEELLVTAGEAYDGEASLWVHSLEGELDEARTAAWRTTPAQPEGNGPRRHTGRLLIGPLVAEPATVQLERLTRWQRVTLAVDGLGERTAVRLATCTMAEAGDPPAMALESAPPPGAALTPAGAWRPAPAGATDLLALNEPAPFLWIAVELRGDGVSTPTARHLTVRYDHEGWLRQLPAVYSADPAGRELLGRLLGGLEAVFDDENALVDALPELFDPAATPDDPSSPWLDWLAGWVAVELDASDEPERRRSAIAEAFARHARRGTVDGLRELLEGELGGGTVSIDEPGVEARLWQLGSGGLGFGTRLVPAEADGAVLGQTATLDRSHLIAEEEHGLPLFADLAHCIVVRVPPRPTAELERLRRLVEEEKPAHVMAHVCPVRPLARLGFQSTVGVDAVVAAGAEPLVLGGGRSRLGAGTRLGEEARAGVGGTLGRRARLGSSATVT